MNEELRGVVHISRTHHTSSHMWNSDTLCHYLDFLKTEIHRKRVSLGLSFDDRAMVLCDAAAVHSCSLYQKIRERFERESNSLLITGGSGIFDETGASPPTIPGGWGATGAPNDAWHQWFHYLRRGWMRVCVGMAGSAKVRKALADMEISIDGNTRISMLSLDYSIVLILFSCAAWIVQIEYIQVEYCTVP